MAHHALKFKDVVLLRNILQDFFIHGRDHALSHAHVFCPYFAWTVYKQTFADTAVYESLTMDPMQTTGFSKSFYQMTISEALQVGNQHHNQQFALGISSV